MFAFAPLSRTLPYWPKELFGDPGGLLDEIGITAFEVSADDTKLEFTGTVAWLREIELKLPALDAVSIAFLSESGFTQVDFALRLGREFELRLINLQAALRLRSAFLRPVYKGGDGKWVPTLDTQGKPVPAEIVFSGVDAIVSADGDVTLDFPAGAPTLSLTPVEFGNTGIVLEMSDIQLYLSERQAPPPGAQEGFKGVAIKSAELHLSGGLGVNAAPSNFKITDLLIGSSGFSGLIEANWNSTYNKTSKTFTGNGSGTLFGIPFGLKSIELELKQSTFQKSEIKGEMLLPFFDEPVEVDIGIDVDGGFTVALTSTGPNGLKKLTKPDVLEIELDSIGFELKDGVFLAKLSGQITPLFGKDKGLDWPAFKVEELSIDSKGHVLLKGGWLALREQYNLNFHGFNIGITKLGFGKTEDGGKWVGFSGEFKLVDGFTAGASVEGLRVTWYEGDPNKTKITLDGVGVEFEIPEVLRFKGDVAYRELQVGTELVHRFEGDIKLDLISLDLKIDAKLIIGTSSGGPQGRYNFFAIYLGVELPNGLRLGATGLALYEMAGLVALQMKPNKTESEEWYEGWYKRAKTGVTDLDSKWVNHRGSMAFGVGATIGTDGDEGFVFSTKALLVILFPGPIFLLEGKANLLTERAKLDDDPLFRALAVLDMGQGQISIGLDATYLRDWPTGRIINIRAGAEAFFHTPFDWHIYLGEREPRVKRIRATVLSLFKADAYFMIEPKWLAAGIWAGFSEHWKFGPVDLSLEAWIESNVVVNWKPLHFHGDLWLHGSLDISVFGFGLGLSLDARFAADVFEPYHVVANFEVSIRLPRPLKKKHVEITLEWGPNQVWPALLPLPLKEVAVEHFKVTTSWPLSKNSTPPLLVPKYDFQEEGLRNYDTNPLAFNAPPIASLPVVPLDCRPHISFGRNVNDDALVGVNPHVLQPQYERIGNPQGDAGPVKVRYSLKQVELFKWNKQVQDWRTVAVAGRALNSGERRLFGSWAAVPQLPSGAGQTSGANVKLWLWSKTPFDYTRHGGSGTDDWFIKNFPTYPCVPQDVPDREVCVDFERLDRSQLLENPWRSPEHPEIALGTLSSGFAPPPKRLTVLDPPVNGFTRALCFPMRDPSSTVLIALSSPAKRVKLWIVERKKSGKVCLDLRNRKVGSVSRPLREQGATIDSGGQIDILSVATTLGNMTGLYAVPASFAGGDLYISLPLATTTVELMLSYLSSPAGATPPRIEALNSSGQPLGARAMLNPPGQPEIVRFESNDLRQITISFSGSLYVLHELCFLARDTTPSVTATGFSADGKPTAAFANQGNVVEISGNHLTRVQVTGPREVCLLKVCALFGPDPKEVAQRQEMAAHLAKEVARWKDEGEVLEPFSAYRLTIATTIHADGEGELSGSRHLDQTEHAYFRTEGPPGLTNLSLPPGRNPADADKFDSGLEDLTLYVRQTTPATVPAIGQKPVMAKPFYRAYDVEVEFNEDYIDLMYRISGRDLGLYLYDSNNRLLRDAEGRLLLESGDWGTVEELTLTEGEQRWVALSNSTNLCLPPIKEEDIAQDKKLGSAVPGRVLEPDMIYEARLIPLLLREGFRSYVAGTTVQGPSDKLGRWEVRDEGNIHAPSRWEVRATGAPVSHYLKQTSNIKSGTDDASDPVKPGTILLYGNDPALDLGHAEQPANWTDYRLTVYLNASEGGAMGLVFRHSDGNNYYRFSMDRDRKYRRLVSVANGIHSILKQDDFIYEPQTDYLITVEAIGDLLRIYQDGALIFEVTDAAHLAGSIGLYCYDNPGVRLNDVRVDDFRQTAPVVYRFEFTTSLFANFFHHLHSYQDETWRAGVDDAAKLSPLAQAMTPAAPPTVEEARAYETLATTVLGPAARQNPPELQVTRVELNNAPVAFLVQSPEPIDWLRTDISFHLTPLARTEPALPGKIKLAAVKFAANRIDIESIALLLREPGNLTGYRIERRLITWPMRSPMGVVIDAQTLSGDSLAELQWATYRTFETEKNLAAGTTVQVLPGDEMAAPSGLKGVYLDVVDPARRISYSIELRLIAPDGRVIHARHFLPHEDYLFDQVKLLRKADGTGVIIARDHVGALFVPFPLLQYRLQLSYKRDNKARAPTNRIFSQAGDDSDEIVSLDIPVQTQ
jgi:hypothetical protein